MKNAYEYLFYQVLSFAKKIKGSDVPEWSAMGFLSVLVFTNLLSIYCSVKLYLLKEVDRINILYVVIIISLIMTVNYFLFISKNKYLAIEKKFKNEELSNKNYKIFLIILYILLTIFIGWYFLTEYREVNMMKRI